MIKYVKIVTLVNVITCIFQRKLFHIAMVYRKRNNVWVILSVCVCVSMCVCLSKCLCGCVILLKEGKRK